ncbi:MAG: phosphoribosyltransferase family protein [Candidatus Acidiferrales bacterium]|jgi:putative phosphoribosyl transferase
MTERIHDRKQAGELLAGKLSALANRPDVIVLGLPRGGVAVACSIATSLRAPLDVFLVRKLGVPGYEELAMGAVAMGDVQVVDPDIVEEFHLSPGNIEKVVNAETRELRRREAAFRGSRPAPDLRDRTVILVDDGIATGSTMRAAIEGVKRLGVARVVVAAGVAPLSTCLLLRPEVDDLVCLLTPREFRAVGLFYEEFPQLSDDEVRRLLDDAWRAGASRAA